MIFKKGIALLILLSFALCLFACDHSGTTNADTTADSTVSEENADRPYHAMKAYVVNVSHSDSIGSMDTLFETDFEFSYPLFQAAYEDMNVAQNKQFGEQGKEELLVYHSSRVDNYRLYDCYQNEETEVVYRFDRADNRLAGVFAALPLEESVGTGFASDEALIQHAESLMEPYVFEDLSTYTASLEYEMEYYGGRFKDYYLLWEYRIDDIVVSRIRMIVPDSGALVHLDLREYHENAATMSISEGTDSACRASVEERIAERRAEREAEGSFVPYESCEIQPGVLYYDEENRSYIFYRAIFKYPYYIESADFVVYLE